MQNHFLDFLRTGRIRGIGTGSTRQEVEAVFGPGREGEKGSRSSPLKSTFYYPGLAVYYDRDAVVFWAIPAPEEFSYDPGEEVVRWDEEFPSWFCTPEAFLKFLNAKGIPYREPTSDETSSFRSFCVTEGGVSVQASNVSIPHEEWEWVFIDEERISGFHIGGIISYAHPAWDQCFYF